METDLFTSFLVLAVTFLVSGIALLTGFGIGTVLTPTFTLFFDVKTAVLLVSVVHLANNVLKFGLFRRNIDLDVFKRFGLVSIAGAAGGSLLQGILDSGAVAVALGLFLILAGINEFLPRKFSIRLPKGYDITGGFLSGLMGGLIGNQGAIRSAYLLNYNLSKESFIATATSIAIVIDLTRIPIYLYNEAPSLYEASGHLILVTICAFGGTFVGKALLQRIPLGQFRIVVASFLILVGVRLFFQS